MEFFERINGHKYLFLKTLDEQLGSNWLRIRIEEGIVGEKDDVPLKEKNPALNEILQDTKPVVVTDQCSSYEILFENYVTYAVLNESYASQEKSAEFSGRRFRIYTKSNFLDYVTNSTFATKEYPGPYKHYGLFCEDHVIHVAAVHEPKIMLLEQK